VTADIPATCYELQCYSQSFNSSIHTCLSRLNMADMAYMTQYQPTAATDVAMFK